MNRQRGQITLYIALGAAALIVGLGIAVKVQSARLGAIKQEYDGFKAQVKANGEAAERAAKAKEAADKATKERIDNETNKLRSANAALSRRLREYVAASSPVSSLAPTTGHPDLACFDRAALDGAIQDYRRGVLAIAEKGTAAVTDLNLALKWAAEIQQKP